MILNIRKLSSFTDYLVICSAESGPQVKAIADAVIDKLRDIGERPLGIEGIIQGRWGLLDFNDVVVHVFLDEVREHYDIDGLWAEAAAVSLTEEPKRVTDAAAKKTKAVKSKRTTGAAAKKTIVKKPKRAVVTKKTKVVKLKCTTDAAPKKTIVKKPKRAAVTKKTKAR